MNFLIKKKLNRKKVSIILPTYNGIRYIKQSIDSCLNQIYKNIELIIVDDGSSENIKKIIDSYKDDRVFYFRHDKNLGLPSALNTGFFHSTGEYLTWTSDDNYYNSKAIDTMVKYLEEKSDIDFIYTNYYVINEKNKIIGSMKVGSPRVLDYKDCVGACFLYRRKVYEKIGEYNSDFILAEDYEYWLRVRKHFKMKKLNKYLYFYRKHDDSLTALNKNAFIQKQAAKASQKYVPLWAKRYHYGWFFFYKKNYKKSARCFIESLFSNPFHFVTWNALFYSLLNIINPTFTEDLKNLKNITKTKFNKIL